MAILAFSTDPTKGCFWNRAQFRLCWKWISEDLLARKRFKPEANFCRRWHRKRIGGRWRQRGRRKQNWKKNNGFTLDLATSETQIQGILFLRRKEQWTYGHPNEDWQSGPETDIVIVGESWTYATRTETRRPTFKTVVYHWFRDLDRPAWSMPTWHRMLQ